MADEGYSHNWDNGNQGIQSAGVIQYGQRPTQQSESLESSSNNVFKPTSPQSRSSIDSAGQSPSSQWRENKVLISDRQELSTVESQPTSLVEPGFDESMLRALCDIDVRVTRPFKLAKDSRHHASLMLF